MQSSRLRADGEGIAGALGEVGHHILDTCVLQQGMPSSLSTVPALLHPTERCLGGGAAVGVHPDSASLDRAGEAVSPREVAGPQAGGQSVSRCLLRG
jgi:hypothetical protein